MHLVDCLRPIANRAHGDCTIDRVDDAPGPHRTESSAQLDQLHALAHQATRDLKPLIGLLHPHEDSAALAGVHDVDIAACGAG